jgi:hypothetical protein
VTSSAASDSSPSKGETVGGVAEPGMPIAVVEGGHTVASTTTGADGHWAVQAALGAGHHTVTAVAQGPQGRSASAPVTFSVAD